MGAQRVEVGLFFQMQQIILLEYYFMLIPSRFYFIQKSYGNKVLPYDSENYYPGGFIPVK